MGIWTLRPYRPEIVKSALCSMEDISAQPERRSCPWASGIVLEIGIGPGLNLPFYNPEQVTKVIGVDPYAAFLSLGEERREASLVPLEVIRAPAEALPLEDDWVHTAVVTYTLCSVDDPVQALKEIRARLSPGGGCCFSNMASRRSPMWRDGNSA